MSIFKCKMCGGVLEINNNESVATCEYCGTQQTLPKLDDDKRANMYDRANHFRRNNEFDKAMGIYEQILNEDTLDCFLGIILSEGFKSYRLLVSFRNNRPILSTVAETMLIAHLREDIIKGL